MPHGFSCGQHKGAGPCSYSSISSETAKTEEEGGSQLIMSHSSYFFFSLPFPHFSHPCFFSQCITPTQVVLCLFLHKPHAVFSACKQMYASTVHYRSWTVRTCDGSPLCRAMLVVMSRQLSLISVTLTSQHPPSTTVNYIPHPVPMWHRAWPVTPQPPLLWVLSSHIALKEPQPSSSLGRDCVML